MRVLVVEDDAEIAELVAARLRRERMAVDVALDGAAGLGRALVYDYDAIVLDRDLPAVHGDDVCRQLVAAGCRARLLMLTAAGTSADLVHGLGLGADDYLAKPFDFAVLVARITALARRAQPAIPPVLRCADVVVDSAGPGRVRRGAAATGVGRIRRPVHEDGDDHAQQAAGQAWRSAADRNGAQVRLPHGGTAMNPLRGLTAIADRSGRLPRRTVRLRLTGLYAALFLGV